MPSRAHPSARINFSVIVVQDFVLRFRGHLNMNQSSHITLETSAGEVFVLCLLVVNWAALSEKWLGQHQRISFSEIVVQDSFSQR